MVGSFYIRIQELEEDLGGGWHKGGHQLSYQVKVLPCVFPVADNKQGKAMSNVVKR